MTLVSGIVCQYKDEKCVLLTGDKALSYGDRLLESPKIKQVSDYKMVVGESGSSSDLQRFYFELEQFLHGFTEEYEHYKNKLTPLTDLMFIQRKFLQSVEEPIDGEALIGATDSKTTKLYNICAGGRKALEVDDFACIGLGANLLGTLMLKSIYDTKSSLSLDEAVRLATVVNILVSRLTTQVSSNFDCIALCNNKLGKLKESSKSQLIKDANFIVNKWLILLRTIFFAPLESKLGFIEDTEIEKLVKEFQKEKKDGKDTVLIIDDMYPQQKGVSNTFDKIFKSEGLKKVICNSRAEFKKIYKNLIEKLRLIILDRRIEHRTTTDILKVISESETSIPIILLSRGLKESDVESFLQKGISFHISKEEIEKEPQKAKELIGGILKEGDYLWEWE